jgi:sec-independent protein translocase protein TatB
MFGIGAGEFLGLVVLALFLVGPDRLPTAAKDFARIIHKVRGFTTNASKELKRNLGPGFEDLNVLGDALEETKPVVAEVRKRSREIKDVAKIDPDLM